MQILQALFNDMIDSPDLEYALLTITDLADLKGIWRKKGLSLRPSGAYAAG